ncbi:MAG: hypothetical protein KIT00_08915 [Rhodospirillales bacterium]|nr:hypothetical protein [Rhodospirillales bacterium]
MSEFAGIPRDRLEDMAAAGAEILECYRLLGKSGANVVSEVLRGEAEFFEWDHYPNGDVYDPETHCQYYYHAHPAGLRGDEHGHFHTFLRPKGMPEGIRPAPLDDFTAPKGDNDALSHLIAISMDKYGIPVGLFTTNRWVTGETWYDAEDVIRMLDVFDMDLSYPSLPVNLWITAMVRLFRPGIEALIRARDRTVAAWRSKNGDGTFEDRDLEVTGHAKISVNDQIEKITAALARR